MPLVATDTRDVSCAPQPEGHARVLLISVFGLKTAEHPARVNSASTHADNALFTVLAIPPLETLRIQDDLANGSFDISAAACASVMTNPVHNITAACRSTVHDQVREPTIAGQPSAGYMLTKTESEHPCSPQWINLGYNIVPTAGLDAKPFVATESIRPKPATTRELADVIAATFIPTTKTSSFTLARSMQTLLSSRKC